ncbi:MAG: RluA family pseudouridine synthase [Clostridia bacterium]|nr:RluA family pseudouridine synthase [Clostridia bacterium]
MVDAFIFNVEENEKGERIDKLVSQKCENLTRSYVQKLIENSEILVNGKPVGKNVKVSQGDVVAVKTVEVVKPDIIPENIPLDIRYEDNCLLVVNKPKGMVVHPAAGNYDGTLVNALMYHCGDSLSGINGVARPGIVHRIDKNTSGLLIVAKNDLAHLDLAEQIKAHSFDREYQAVVYGHLKEKEGTINAPIGRNPNNRLQMCVTDKNSKNAVTHYEVIKEYKDFSHVRLILETGRTHQIRVHMKYIGHPVAGDDVYGPSKVIKQLGGQCLHAAVIGFKHPASGERIKITSELPEYFTRFLGSLKTDGGG